MEGPRRRGPVPPARLEQEILAYFEQKDAENGRYGPLDLAAYLGLDKAAFYALLDDPQCAPSVRWALTKIAGQMETGKNWDATRAVFLLKQADIAGYADRPDPNAGGQIKVRIYFGDAENSEVFS